MIGAHLRTFVWLRWALLRNAWRRAGTFSNVVTSIVTVSLFISALPMFFGAFAAGVYLIPRATPAALMYVWDGLVVVFLFFWGIGLLTELQRSDTLSLDKFLHLPVSVRGAFLINYVSSLARLSLVMFVPPMLGYAIALVWVKGPSLLVALPLLAAFLLMVTAITYQIQGYLAALMSNPRKRRTVIVVLTSGFVLMAQLPNLINIYAPWMRNNRADSMRELMAQQKELIAELQVGKIPPEEYSKRLAELTEANTKKVNAARQQRNAEFAGWVRLANVVQPAGWLPAGVMDAAAGSILPALAGLLGMTAIGATSLGLAYRSTLRLYQGTASAHAADAPPRAIVEAEAAADAPTRPRRGNMLERRPPWLSEPVAVVALGGLRSLLRAPEAKMMLLTPIIMVPVLGAMIFRTGVRTLPESVRPLLGLGAMSFTLFGFIQVMSNQFGFDRDGFRVYVLSAARRRDILLGKNLAIAPLVLPLMLLLVVGFHIFSSMRADHLLAMVPAAVSMFALFCTTCNLMSIVAPVYIPSGAMKASNIKASTVLIQMVLFTVLFPLTQGLVFLPLGVEALARHFGWIDRAPLFLLLSVAEMAVVLGAYALTLNGLGSLLRRRETLILETVTNRG